MHVYKYTKKFKALENKWNQGEKVFKETEDNFRGIFNVVKDCIFVNDVETGALVSIEIADY